MTQIPSESDPFEREIREALEREAGDPAPERLVARIARSRAEARPPAGGLVRLRALVRPVMALGLPLGVGLAAIAVLVFAGGSIFRPTGPASTPFLPGASGTPDGSAAPGASETPGASVPIATPVPTDLVLRSPTPSADGSAGGPVPADFQPVSVTFVSASRGWLLGSTTCAGSPCAVILRTADAGVTWARIPAPATQVAPNAPSGTGVSELRFATSLDGWAFGPDLWATHDGGATWHREALPGAAGGAQVMALEAAGGTVHVAFYAGGAEGIAIATSPVTGGSLRLEPTGVPIGAGPVPQTQIVLHGAAGWLVQVDRAVVGGARLSNGAWQAWQPPCLNTAGPAWLAASSATNLAAACDMGIWSTPLGVHLFTSTDGGTTFAQQAATVPITSASLRGIAAAPASSTIVIAGSVAGGDAALVATFDGGRTWSRVATLSGLGAYSELGFTTSLQGVAITRTVDGASHLVMTHDGGRTWGAVQLVGR